MDKEWFIIVGNQQEGPYDLIDLKKDPRVTPDTLVWKKGFKEWVPARLVAALTALFEDETESQPLHEKPKTKPLKTDLGLEQVTVAMHQDPYQLLLWILLLLLVLFYAFYQLNDN
jgi:hypothetical protein